MVIGKGSISSVITDREDFIFFARGESNRFPLDEQRKRIERERILEFIDTNKMFVYISGLHIYYPDGGRSDYNEHKIKMEQLVRNNFRNYCIMRLGSIIWGDNPNTIVNYMKAQIKINPEFEGRKVYRYLHTEFELNHWFGMIPRFGKHEMNVTGKLTWVPDLVEQLKSEQ